MWCWVVFRSMAENTKAHAEKELKGGGQRARDTGYYISARIRVSGDTGYQRGYWISEGILDISGDTGYQWGYWISAGILDISGDTGYQRGYWI